jgi:hypothetical protein
MVAAAAATAIARVMFMFFAPLRQLCDLLGYLWFYSPVDSIYRQRAKLTAESKTVRDCQGASN